MTAGHDFAANLAAAERRRVDVGVGNAFSQRRDEFLELADRDALVRHRENVGRTDHASHRAARSAGTNRTGETRRPRVRAGFAQPRHDAASDTWLPDMDV